MSLYENIELIHRAADSALKLGFGDFEAVEGLIEIGAALGKKYLGVEDFEEYHDLLLVLESGDPVVFFGLLGSNPGSLDICFRHL